MHVLYGFVDFKSFLTSPTKPFGTVFTFILSKHLVMKKRNQNYLQRVKALQTMGRVREIDLNTFLNATFQLAKSNVVKKHIQIALTGFNPAA
jgi:hypothetical protein